MSVLGDTPTNNLYRRQLARAVYRARQEQTSAAAMCAATARMVANTQPPPDGRTHFAVMTWAERGGEILPSYLSKIDGPVLPAGWSDLSQFAVWQGHRSVEQAMVEFPEAVAVPTAMLFEFNDARLTASPADHGWSMGLV